MSYELQSKEQQLRTANCNYDPIVLIVDDILHTAISMKASDIHLEPSFLRLRIRYRIDGILYDQEPIPLDRAEQIISRLKILSSLNIAETRLPQDGKIMINLVEEIFPRTIDLRISTFPTVCGEKMVIRILDRGTYQISLESIGLPSNILNDISKLISQPNGLLLVTGPTGSGKTTTLYAILSKLNKREKNIVTIEDPVEYYIDGISQSQVNKGINFSFDQGLPFLLRQDPDIIMIGEIRDKATAHIAVESALTGHLVLSSLHTNNAIGAIARLIDMGVEPFLINGALSGVLAQRLVRLLCPNCKHERALTETEQMEAKKYNLTIKTSWESTGCKQCFGLGHTGRTGIFELLLVDDTIRSLIISRATTKKIQAHLSETGLISMQSNAVEKVINGSISITDLFCTVPHE